VLAIPLVSFVAFSGDDVADDVASAAADDVDDDVDFLD
jgi:hypothetical protein